MEWKRIETRWNEIVGRLKQQERAAKPAGDSPAVKAPVADPRAPAGRRDGSDGATRAAV